MLVSLAKKISQVHSEKTNICVKKNKTYREGEKKFNSHFFLKNPNPVANSKQTKENPQINCK